MKLWLARVLLFFAIFTLGFGLGKAVGLRRVAAGRDAAPAPTVAAATDKAVVYYLHATFRCATCNGIEELAKRVVEEDFASEYAVGKVEWRTANFQERTDLAARYGVASSTIVVVDVEGGEEKGFRRLDEVWTLCAQPGALAEHVSGAIRDCLSGAP